jgi:ribosome-associated protein
VTTLPATVQAAARAALAKKAEAVLALDLRQTTDFTDFFLLVSGQNQRQLVAIADSVIEALRALERRPAHVEGYPRHEWILLDYSSFVVHVMTPKSRSFYDLERLWGGARRLEITG